MNEMMSGLPEGLQADATEAHGETTIFNSLQEFFQVRYPDILRETAEEVGYCAALEYRRDEAATEYPLELLGRLGIDVSKIEQTEGGQFRIEIPPAALKDIKPLPASYAYKGGAARFLLRRVLDLGVQRAPRDYDLIRISEDASRDKELAQEFMPDDAAHGYGVEDATDLDQYFATRDFTLNELYATSTALIATEACLLDTARGIVRLTDHELGRGLGPKLYAKALRLYAEAILAGEELDITPVETQWGEEDITPTFIQPFWIALQLDRAYEQGNLVAENFVQTLVSKRQLPDNIASPEEARTYLNERIRDRPFHFRHVPAEELALEDSFVAERFVNLPLLESHRKPRAR